MNFESPETQFEELDQVFVVPSHNLTKPSCRPKNFVSKELKQAVSQLMKPHKFMYDKKHSWYRNQTKRKAVWAKIAAEINFSVAEVKTVWKSVKGMHRLKTLKSKSTGKSGDCALDDIDDIIEEMGEDDLDLTYLDEQSASLYRETVSIGGGSTFPRPQSSISTDGENDYELQTNRRKNPATSYSYMDKIRKNRIKDNPIVGAMESINNTMTTLASQENNNPKLKRHAIWAGLENMMDHLDENEVMDLNMSFMSQIHAVILAKRSQSN